MSAAQTLAMRRHCLATLLATLASPGMAGAALAAFALRDLGHEWQDLPLRGRSLYRFWGLDIYEASLWLSPQAGLDWPSHRLVLSLRYQRSFSAQAIAERSLQEMQRQGQLASAVAETWRNQLGQVLTDVQAGERLTVAHQPQHGLRFWHHAQRVTLLGEIADPVFSERFLGIWLSPASSAPALRQALLGLAS
jgi:hypothetical protein